MAISYEFCCLTIFTIKVTKFQEELKQKQLIVVTNYKVTNLKNN